MVQLRVGRLFKDGLLEPGRRVHLRTDLLEVVKGGAEDAESGLQEKPPP